MQVSHSSNCTRHNELGDEDDGMHNATADDSAQKQRSLVIPQELAKEFLPHPLALI